jgi:hypothetical protein
MEQAQIYEQTLINAADRVGEIAKDVAGLGDKHVSVYTANTIAHKADLEMHIILKALGKESESSHQARCAAILKEKDAIDKMAIDLVREILNERPDKKITLVELDDDEEVVDSDEYGIDYSGFSYWDDTDETHAIVTEVELVNGSIRVTVKPDYGCVQSDWYEYLLVDNVAFMNGIVDYVSK